jgi:raffinose/stachyose/melibiose transport system permease protein
MKKKFVKNHGPYLLLLAPALLLYLVFKVYPFISTIGYSFTNYSVKRLIEFDFVGFKNYISVFNSDLLTSAIKNSIVYAGLMTILQPLCAIPLAVLLDRKIIGRNILRSAFFLPAVFSPLVIGFLWSFIYSNTKGGLINGMFLRLGLPMINFLGDGDIALFAVVFSQLWQWIGWAMVIYMANLQTIPKSYYEAAKIDGAGNMQSFWLITLPMLQPATAVVIITAMIGGLQVFDVIHSLTGGGPGFATETIMTAMVRKSFAEGQYGLGSAFGVVFLIIVLLITLIIMRYLKQWEEKLL